MSSSTSLFVPSASMPSVKKRSLSSLLLTEERPAKRQAFNVAKEPSVKAAEKRNMIASPLLSLPAEIRQKIWIEVVGYKQVRIIPKDAKSKCEFVNTKQCITKDDWFNGMANLSRSEDREHVLHCNKFKETCTNARCIHPDVPWMPLLRTCRQAYLEANPVLWTTCVFWFNEAVALRKFVEKRTTHQKKLLCNVELVFLGSCDMFGWSQLMPKTIVKTLTGLRSVKISFNIKILDRVSADPNPALDGGLWHLGRPYSWSDNSESQNLDNLARGIKKLAVLAIEEVEIQFNESGWRANKGIVSKAPSDENKQWLLDLKRSLLEHTDAPKRKPCAKKA